MATVSLEQAVVDAFFGSSSRMQASLAVLCDSIHCDKTKKAKGGPSGSTDPVTQTVLMLLSAPMHVQLTVVGWQPLKGLDLTFPFHLMTPDQKQAIKNLVEGEPLLWSIYEHAMSYRRHSQSPLPTLSPLDVLGALCSSILESTAYKDKRLRVAVCNILLQRVQASIPIDKQTQAALNARLFPPSLKNDG
jgi:hypothetical protein